MKQVAVYAYKNVATTGREIPTQIDECTRYAERMGFEIVKVYADTGTRQQREMLLKDSRKGAFSAVIATAADRIDRNAEVFRRVIMELQKNGVKVYFADGTNTTEYVAFLKNFGSIDKKRRNLIGG